MVKKEKCWEVIIVGGGMAGLSAAIYLSRAQRETLIIDGGKSLARWEPDVQNYLGFPEGIAGEKLLERGRAQAKRFGAEFRKDTIEHARREDSGFLLSGKPSEYSCRRLLLATGLFHLPPEVPGARDCLGTSLFFCKDCDAYRVRDCRIAVIGSNDEAVEYVLGMFTFSACVVLATNGETPSWNAEHSRWIEEYEIPTYEQRIAEVEHASGRMSAFRFADGSRVALECAFTTRGDIYHNTIAQELGARMDVHGEVCVDQSLRTSVPGLYAAGCVTPANCQMIISAGEGAAAAQAINRDLFEESLRTHSLRRLRVAQRRSEQTIPEVIN
jgi:thioredoxin reductase (NADPH)